MNQRTSSILNTNFTFNGFSDVQFNSVLNILQRVASTNKGRPLFNGSDIVFNVSNKSSGNDGIIIVFPGYIEHVFGERVVNINFDDIGNTTYVNDFGALEAFSLERLVVHELAHASLGLPDLGRESVGNARHKSRLDEPDADFKGETVDFTNEVLNELGASTIRLAYVGVPGKPGLQLTEGNKISNVYIGTTYGLDSERMNGGSGAELFLGYAGNDNINSGGGDDYIYGGDGDDTVKAGEGDDFIEGGEGKDQLNGDAGNDRINGKGGNDSLEGGDGTDTAIFSDIFDNYDIETSDDEKVTTISHVRGSGDDGIDTLTNVEFGQFSDITVPLPLRDGPEDTESEEVIDAEGEKLGAISLTLPTFMFDGDAEYTVTLSESNPSIQYNFAYIIDVSQSMTRDGKLEAAQAAYTSLTNFLIESGVADVSQFAVIPFNIFSSVQAPLSANEASNLINNLGAGGQTEYFPVLIDAEEYFSSLPPGATNIAYFLSDGQPFIKVFDMFAEPLKKVADVRAFGIGDADLSLLNVVDSNNAVFLSDPNALIDQFDVSGLLKEEISEIEIQLEGETVETISPEQLEDTPLGLRFSGEIDKLKTDSDAENKITAKITLVDNSSSSVDFIVTRGEGSGSPSSENDDVRFGSDDFDIDTGSGDDKIIANDLDNILSGGEGNDQIEGTGGDDLIFPGEGSDRVDGGAGNDTVAYQNTQAQQGPINKVGNIITIGDSEKGIDTLTNVEFLRFLDVTLATDTLTTAINPPGTPQPPTGGSVNPVPPNTSMIFTPFDPVLYDAQSLVEAILAADADLSIIPESVEFVGNNGQTAFYDGSITDLSIGAGIFLTSGDGTPPLENTEENYSASFGSSGDSDLDTVARSAFPEAGLTEDANVLAFTFIVENPEVRSISFDLLFGSDEFPEFSNSDFVDIAAVFINGNNQALFNGEESQPLSIIDENLVQGNFINNDSIAPPPPKFSGQTRALPIEYNAVSSVLTVLAPVQQGENTIKIGIADTGDSIYDSGLWVSNLRTRNLGDNSENGSGGDGDGVRLNIPGTVGDDTLEGSDLNEFFDAGSGNDIINAGAGDDVIDAGDGDDQIEAGEGNDTINPGSDDDIVNGSEGDDTINGGEGNDIINGGEGEDTVVYSGDLGEFQVSKEVDTVLVGKSNGDKDELTNVELLQFDDQSVDTKDISQTPVNQNPSAVNDGLPTTVAFTTDEDSAFTTDNVLDNDSDPEGDSLTVTGFDNTSTLGVVTDNNDGTFDYNPNGEFDFLSEGETTTDSFTYTVSDSNGSIDTATVTITVTGIDTSIEPPKISDPIETEGDDIIVGTEADETIDALGGDDLVAGGLGDDDIQGGDGDDILRGDLNRRSPQNNIAGGNDTIRGGNGNDRIGGKAGNDRLFGDAGDDQIWGDNGDDIIAGGLGDDEIFGGNGDDILRGDLNRRSPRGGAAGGDDIIRGGKGNDRIGGKAGNDQLFGDEGDDQLFGDDGDDLLYGGLGDDMLTGDDSSNGKGSDTFVLAAGEGLDTITDFKAGIDFIGLSGGLSFGSLTFQEDSGDTLVQFESNTLAKVMGVSELIESNFITV